MTIKQSCNSLKGNLSVNRKSVSTYSYQTQANVTTLEKSNLKEQASYILLQIPKAHKIASMLLNVPDHGFNPGAHQQDHWDLTP